MFPARGRAAKRKTRIETFPAPRRGWVASARLIGAPTDAAEVLDNVFPTAEGGRVRRGATLHATLPAAAKQLMAYVSGSQAKMFASTATSIYDVTTSTPALRLSGLTNGDWSWTQFATAATEYMICANGSDNLALFDGSNWNPLAAQAITNLPYDGQTAAFTVGATVTNGTASAVILGIANATATTGVLKVGTITGGSFSDNNAITDNGTTPGAAVVNGSASSALAATITGVAGSALSFIWPHKSRLWGVEEGTLNLWYWPVGQIGGTLIKFPLQGIFQYGGAVLFGGTVSMDTGTGMDDRLVVVTTEGEVAIYAGTDPADIDGWALEGIYRIGRPLSKQAWFRAGGDLVIATEDGITSVLQAVQQDRAALMAGALTAFIEDAWQAIVTRRRADFPFSLTLWHSQTLLLVGTPTEDSGASQAFVANSRTGAWARYTGWDVRCSVVHQDRLYFGGLDGRIALAETGGSDFGAPYFARWVPKFTEGKSVAQKFAVCARVMVRAVAQVRFALTALADWQVTALRTTHPTTASDGDAWGTGIWGTSIWGGGRNTVTRSDWQTVSAFGYTVAPAVTIGSGSVTEPEIELAAMHLMVEEGAPL